MKKKYRVILSIVLISLILDIPHVNAYSFKVDYADTGSGGNEQKKEKDPIDLGTETSGKKTYKYTCEYDYEVGKSNKLTINGYNNDKSIMDSSLKISKKDRIPSGTAIKLNIYETKTVWYKVTSAKAKVEVTTEKTCTYYDCTYTNSKGNASSQPVPPPIFNVLASIKLFSRVQKIALNCAENNIEDVTSCEDYFGCTTNSKFSHTSNCDEVEKPKDAPDKQEECEEAAAKIAIAAANKLFGGSYKINASDSNDINGTKTTSLSISSGGGQFSGTNLSGSKTVTYTYSMNRVCMNVLNAKVRYTNDSECNDEEIEVKDKTINSKKYWHYFLPLNGKSNQYAEFNLKQNGENVGLEAKECHYVMQNNPVTSDDEKTSYLDLIIKNDNTNFNGDYELGNRGYDYNEIEKNGCILTSKIKIPVVQKFYNEIENEDDTTKFKGFNFYYKPISINVDDNKTIENTVFPNGITENSLWKEWYESENKKPNLIESYNIITYRAINIDANAIRNYNINNLYTDWNNMSTNGRSKFIENYNYINRNGDINVYKLGCGPNNKNWSDCQ